MAPTLSLTKRSHFVHELSGKVHLTQYDAVSSINPDLARRTMEAQRKMWCERRKTPDLKKPAGNKLGKIGGEIILRPDYNAALTMT